MYIILIPFIALVVHVKSSCGVALAAAVLGCVITGCSFPSVSIQANAENLLCSFSDDFETVIEVKDEKKVNAVTLPLASVLLSPALSLDVEHGAS